MQSRRKNARGAGQTKEWNDKGRQKWRDAPLTKKAPYKPDAGNLPVRFDAVAFPAFTVSRLGLQKQAQKAIEALGCPFVTTLMEKCLIDEGHPQFAGMYAGSISEPKTRQIVEGADIVLDLGGVNLNDITTAVVERRCGGDRTIQH